MPLLDRAEISETGTHIQGEAEEQGGGGGFVGRAWLRGAAAEDRHVLAIMPPRRDSSGGLEPAAKRAGAGPIRAAYAWPVQAQRYVDIVERLLAR